MSALPGPWSADEHLARAVLPELDDLVGGRWTLDASDDDGAPGARTETDMIGLMAESLPPGFDDKNERASAEVAFTRPGHALVIGLATVFATTAEATEAWTALMDDVFARRFAESVAAEVQFDGPIELLGPVTGPSALTIERAGVRTARHRAVFSGANPASVMPIALHFAVTACGRALVLVWAVDEGGAADDVAWDHLIERVELRSELARAGDSGS